MKCLSKNHTFFTTTKNKIKKNLKNVIFIFYVGNKQSNSRVTLESSSIKWTLVDGFGNSSLNFFKHIDIVDCNA